MDLDRALRAWRELLGAEQVLAGAEAQARCGQAVSGLRRRISAVLRIGDPALLPAVLQVAGACGVAVYPVSTGHNWGYGTALPVAEDCVVLDLSGLDRILHFDAQLGVVTLEPGVTQGMLAAFLDAGQHPYLVPVTGGGPRCSLVGNALERGYGLTPHTDHFAAVTDLEAVLPDGSLYRSALREAGGEDLARLFKWGVGPYTAGLFSQGNFGIVTRMSLHLARRPPCVRAGLFILKEDGLLERAVDLIQELLASLPGIVGGINLMNRRRVLAMVATRTEGWQGPLPEEALAVLGRRHQVFPWTGLATLYGTPEVVAAAQKAFRRRLSGVASRLVFLNAEQAGRLERLAGLLPGALGAGLARTAATLAQTLALVNGRPNETALAICYPDPPKGMASRDRDPVRDGCGLLWYSPLVPMRAATVRAYAAMVNRVCLAHGIEPLITLTSVSDKLYDSTVPIRFERTLPRAQEAAMACYDELLREGTALGCFPYRMGIQAMEALAARQTHSRRFQARLKATLDPDGLLSPGRYSG